MIDERVLKKEERAIFSLRSLYRKYGYMPYKMSKFEEYELYIRNKDFLVSDRIIAFNDTNGKLMALKPDVTLSIIKNSDGFDGSKQKVCYNENVYRVSQSTGQYKEIMQTGLECIGDTDIYDIYETVMLAAKSLETISEKFVLEISHLGILSAVFDAASPDAAFKKKAVSYISEKNSHDLLKLCKEYDIDEHMCNILATFVSAYGKRSEVLKTLKANFSQYAEEAVAELEELSKMLDSTPFSDKILFDFSVVNDMNYYNGIVFRGFLDGICDGVLAGGRYDNLMKKMGKKSGAIGFALYIDLLEQLNTEESGYDTEVLLLYKDSDNPSEVAAKARELVSEGKSVDVQKSVPPKIRYKETIIFKGGASDA